MSINYYELMARRIYMKLAYIAEETHTFCADGCPGKEACQYKLESIQKASDDLLEVFDAFSRTISPPREGDEHGRPDYRFQSS